MKDGEAARLYLGLLNEKTLRAVHTTAANQSLQLLKLTRSRRQALRTDKPVRLAKKAKKRNRRAQRALPARVDVVALTRAYPHLAAAMIAEKLDE